MQPAHRMSGGVDYTLRILDAAEFCSGYGRALRSEGVEPLQIGEATEVLIRGGQDGAVLQRQRGENGIRHERAACSIVANEFFEWERVGWFLDWC